MLRHRLVVSRAFFCATNNPPDSFVCIAHFSSVTAASLFAFQLKLKPQKVHKNLRDSFYDLAEKKEFKLWKEKVLQETFLCSRSIEPSPLWRFSFLVRGRKSEIWDARIEDFKRNHKTIVETFRVSSYIIAYKQSTLPTSIWMGGDGEAHWPEPSVVIG